MLSRDVRLSTASTAHSAIFAAIRRAPQQLQTNFGFAMQHIQIDF
jgi:hypothetical protein